MKKYLIPLAILFTFGLGFIFSKWMYNAADKQSNTTEATVLLEKVKKVFKVVTVEGNFSEVYDKTNYKEMTVFLPLPNTFRFPKTATLQVTGKVLVGYDMEGIQIDVDSLSKTLILSNIPNNAEILAIDHELSYKNLDDSFFNRFTTNDYNLLNKHAKEVLRNEALNSSLMREAEMQGNQMISLVEDIATSAGWQVIIKAQQEPAFKN